MLTAQLCVGLVGGFFFGDALMRDLVDRQPMKVAAAEALFESEGPAALSLVATGDFSTNPGKTNREIKIPHLLSVLATLSWDGEVKGVNPLNKEYRAILEMACAEAVGWMVAKYDAVNPAALKRLIANGVQLSSFSDQVMAAFYKTSKDVFDEIATQNPKFKKVYEPWNRFREEQVQWFSIAEGRYDNFAAAAMRVSQRGSTPKN